MDSLTPNQILDFLNTTSIPVTLTDLCTHFKVDKADSTKLTTMITDLETANLLETLQFPKEEGTKYKLTYTVKSITSDKPQAEVENKEPDYTQMTDEELDKLYKSLLLSFYKVKEKKYSVENSDIKKKKIKKLHEYNEIKDACQTVLGKMARLKGKTISTLHEEYELDVS